MSRRRKDLLLELLRGAGEAPNASWHTSLLAALQGVSASRARWTPAPDRPSIWAITRHVTHWKKAVTTALDQDHLDVDATSASDWEALPDDDAAWDADRDELARVTRLLAQRLAAADDRLLDRELAGLGGTIAGNLAKLATHDAYHAGQVRVLLRLQEALATVR